MRADLRLKIIRFIRKYKKIIGIAILIWLAIVLINQMMKKYEPPAVPEITYTPHVSVMDSSSAVPNTVSKQIEKQIEEYVGYCNDGNYQKAFAMLSEECRKYSFNNDIFAFQRHVLTKMPTKKEYSIQNYSNSDGMYIYQIKYTDNILATGLTGQVYNYTEEKITFERLRDGTLLMLVGNYIRQADIKSVAENEYLKVDILEKIVNYSIETYKIKFTNRSDYIVVISDQIELNEITLQLANEFRERGNAENVVLQPKESKELTWAFPKFSDDGKQSGSIVLGAVRIMEKYSGADEEEIGYETIMEEIENAIAKFSMQIPIVEK